MDFEQLPGNCFPIFFSISRNFTKYYLHAKFQINWTIQTEITEGVRISPPLAIPICKKPNLFRVKGFRLWSLVNRHFFPKDKCSLKYHYWTKALFNYPIFQFFGKWKTQSDHHICCCMIRTFMGAGMVDGLGVQ